MDFKKLKESIVEKFKPVDEDLYYKSPNYRVVRDWFFDDEPGVPKNDLYSFEDVFSPDDKVSYETLIRRNRHKEEMSSFVYKYIETPYIVSSRVLGENVIWQTGKLRTYLRNIWRFKRSLSQCHVFDSQGMYELLIDQLNQMIPFFESGGAMTVNSNVRAKEMRIFRRLLQYKLNEDLIDNSTARYNFFNDTNKDFWEIPYHNRTAHYSDLINIPCNVKYRNKEEYLKQRQMRFRKRDEELDTLLLKYFKKIPMWWD